MLCLLIGLWINQLDLLSLQTIVIHYCQTFYLSQSALQNCNKSKWLRFHSELVFWLLYLHVNPITHAVVLWQQTRHTDLNWTDSKWLKMSGQSRSQTVCGIWWDCVTHSSVDWAHLYWPDHYILKFPPPPGPWLCHIQIRTIAFSDVKVPLLSHPAWPFLWWNWPKKTPDARAPGGNASLKTKALTKVKKNGLGKVRGFCARFLVPNAAIGRLLLPEVAQKWQLYLDGMLRAVRVPAVLMP